jgi:hypothetical protein
MQSGESGRRRRSGRGVKKVLSRRLGESESRRAVTDGESRRVGGDSVFAVSHWWPRNDGTPVVCRRRKSPRHDRGHFFFSVLTPTRVRTRRFFASDSSSSRLLCAPPRRTQRKGISVYVSTRRAHAPSASPQQSRLLSSAAPVTHDTRRRSQSSVPGALRWSPETQADQLRTSTSTPCRRWQQRCASVPRTASPAAPPSGCARRPRSLRVRQCSSKVRLQPRLLRLMWP